MKTSVVGRILMAIIFASVIGGISAGPALGKNDNRGHGPKQQGRHDNGRWHDDRGWHDNRGREVYHSYRYATGTYLCTSAGYLCPGAIAGHQHLFPSDPHSIGES